MKLGKLAIIVAVFTVCCFAISYMTVPKAENGKSAPFPLSLLSSYKNLSLVSRIGGSKDVDLAKQVNADGVEKLKLQVESADIEIKTNDSNVITAHLKGQFTKQDP